MKKSAFILLLIASTLVWGRSEWMDFHKKCSERLPLEVALDYEGTKIKVEYTGFVKYKIGKSICLNLEEKWSKCITVPNETVDNFNNTLLVIVPKEIAEIILKENRKIQLTIPEREMPRNCKNPEEPVEMMVKVNGV